MRMIRLVALLLVAVPISAQTTKFCDLIHHPEKYNGQIVEVRATFWYGFEWQELYCLDCRDHGKLWLTLPIDLEDTSKKSLKKMPKGAGIVNLTVRGIFEFGSTYGHSNGYRYQIAAQQIRDVVLIQKNMKNVAEEKKAEQRWACGGANPK